MPNALPTQIVPNQKPTMRTAYKQLTQWVIEEIAPLYLDAELEVDAATLGNFVAVLFNQACARDRVE